MTLIVLVDGGHRGTVGNNGCQELPLIPPVLITSTNRHTHLPLDVGKVKESDWMLERSRNWIGCWKGQGIKWVCLLVEVIQTGGISGNSWQPLLPTVLR